MSTKENIKRIAAKSIGEVRAAAEKLSRVKGFNLAGLAALGAIAPEVVKHVEAIANQEGLRGADKKELAIELVLQLVHLPAWCPEFVARWVLGRAIEAAVAAINRAR